MVQIHKMKPIFLIITLFISGFSFSQSKLKLNNVDLTKFIKDIMVSKTDQDETVILYWFSDVYWDIFAAKDPKTLSPEIVKQFKEMLSNKSVFVAVAGKINPNTQKFESKSEDVLRKSFVVKFKGKSYKAIPESKLSDELKIISESLGQMFSRMLGDFGSGLVFFYTEIVDENGQNALNPYSNNELTIGVSSIQHTFHLPLPSLFMDAKCSNDGELFPANYEFCPYHGSKLIIQ